MLKIRIKFFDTPSGTVFDSLQKAYTTLCLSFKLTSMGQHPGYWDRHRQAILGKIPLVFQSGMPSGVLVYGSKTSVKKEIFSIVDTPDNSILTIIKMRQDEVLD